MKNSNKFIGVIALAAVIMFGIAACDDSKSTEKGPPENWPVAERWSKYVSEDSTATLDISVNNDSVCTITVGGVAEPHGVAYGKWNRYKTSAQYKYTAKANTIYTYKFEAWTASDSRNVNFLYYYDNDGEEFWLQEENFPINSTRQTYTVRGESIPKDGVRELQFQCADKLGTFYVKILSITEN